MSLASFVKCTLSQRKYERVEESEIVTDFPHILKDHTHLLMQPLGLSPSELSGKSLTEGVIIIPLVVSTV